MENVSPDDLSVPLSINTGAQVTDTGMGPDLAVPNAGAADLAVPNGMRYTEPTLNGPNDRFSTPYYAAYTNSGDLAAATYAADGQGVRLVDPKTGEVLYSGQGPEAAKYATGLANALSQDQGRKAAWAIQVDHGGDQGWTTTGSDRADPKHNLLGKIADIALPVLGSILLPGVGGILGGALGAGVGAAGGSALSSVAQGRSLGSTLTRAALSGVGAGAASHFLSPAVSGVLSGGATPAATGAATNAAATAAGAGAGGAAGGAGNLLSELVVQGISPTATALASGAGAALPGVVNGLTRNTPSIDYDTPQAPTANTVDEVVVTANKLAGQGLSVGDMVAMGIPAAVAISAAAGGSGGTGFGVDTTKLPANPGATSTLPAQPANTSISVLDNAKAWVAAHPLEAAALGLTAAGAIGGGSGSGSGGSLAINPNAGKLASLGPAFSAALPAPTVGQRTQRPLAVDWKHYGEGPERSFFSNVPDPWAVQGVH